MTDWVGLNITRQHLAGGIGVAPFLGLVFDPIEKIVQQLLPTREVQPTLVTSLGYLMPEKRFLEWVFPASPEFDRNLEAQKIVAAVLEFGEPIIKRICNLSGIIESLENLHFVTKESAAIRLPIAYGLAGRENEAHKYVRRALEELAGRNDFTASDMRQMYSGYLRMTGDLESDDQR